MKRMMIVALALSLAAGAAEARPDKGRGHDEGQGRYERGGRPEVSGPVPRGPAWERTPGGRWGRGQTLPPAYRGSGVDYRSQGLRRPPGGYGWVRVGPDYLLMDRRTGMVLDVIPGR